MNLKRANSLKEYHRLHPNWNNFVKTPEYKLKMSVACSGKKNGMYGRKHKEESKRKMRLKALKRWQDPKYRQKNIENRDIEKYKIAQEKKMARF